MPFDELETVHYRVKRQSRHS